MLISVPQLTPLEGYVEVEIDGERKYQKIETEQDKTIKELTARIEELTEVIDALLTGGATE